MFYLFIRPPSAPSLLISSPLAAPRAPPAPHVCSLPVGAGPAETSALHATARVEQRDSLLSYHGRPRYGARRPSQIMGPSLRGAGVLVACLALSPSGVVAFPNATGGAAVGGALSTDALKHIHSARSLLDKLGSPPHMDLPKGPLRQAQHCRGGKGREGAARYLPGRAEGSRLAKAVEIFTS